MQSEEDRKIRFRSQGNTGYENNIIPIRYGAILKYDPQFYTNKVVADTGCGFGGGTHLIATRYGAKKVYGIDINKDDIKLARQSFSNDNIEYIEAYTWETSLPTKSMDIVTNVECIEHNDYEEIALMLTEIHRILKPNGVLMITTPNKRKHLVFPSGSHFMEYEFEELQHIVNGFGFEFVWGEPNIGVDSMCLLFKKI